MFDRTPLRSLAQLPQPLLTVYVNATAASTHAPRPGCLTWLKNEAYSSLANSRYSRRRAYERRHSERCPHEINFSSVARH